MSADPLPRESLAYLRFALQAISVGLAYFLVQFAVLLPALIPAALAGEDPSLHQLSVLAALASPLSALAAVGVAYLWLRQGGRFAQALGLVPVANWPHTLGLALLATGGVLAIFGIGGVAVEAAGLASPDIQAVLDMVTATPALFALWIVAVAWLGAGLGEELLFRGFLFDTLQRLPGMAGRLPVALVMQAAIFGLAHVYQGWGGVLITGAVGLLLGWIRLRAGGAIWAAAIAHAAVDTIMLSTAYAGEMGWVGG
jgi:membrane protease YdiL (CAAX protease family)